MSADKTRTPGEKLRAAAATLRDAAKTATRGPWVPYPTITADQHDEAWTITRTWCDQDPCEKDCGHTVLKTGAEGCEEDSIRGEDAAWICLVNPLLAEPLAVWLEVRAQQADELGAPGPLGYTKELLAVLDVAHVINGSDQ